MGAAQGDAALVHLGRPVRPARLMVVEHGGGGGGGGQYQLAISEKVVQRILNWDFFFLLCTYGLHWMYCM